MNRRVEVEGFEGPRPGDAGYWERLIRGESPDALDEVAHTDMGRAFNKHAYRLRRRAASQAVDVSGVLADGGFVFEAGFGVGFYLALWQEYRAVVSGVDLSSSAVHNVRSRFPRYDLRQGDLASIHEWMDWDSLVASFDVVTAIDVLYHIVDDGRAAAALRNLAALVRPGGVLLFTEKFPDADDTVKEHVHVTRRPLRWFEEVARDQQFGVERVAPVFWCMDPALPNPDRSVGDHVARALWVAMRAATKYLPRRSHLQERVGAVGGLVGASLDSALVGHARSTGNLRMITMRRASETSARTPRSNRWA